MNDEDPESRQIWVSGYVVRDPSPIPSNWRSRRTLEDDLANAGVVGIRDIDTRALTRHLRDRGAMRVGIFSWCRCEAPEADLVARVLDARRWPDAISRRRDGVRAYVVPPSERSASSSPP